MVDENSYWPIERYTEIIENNPASATAYYNRGIMHANYGNYREALEDFSSTLALDETFVDAFVNRGWVFLKLNQYEKAILD